MAKKKTILNLQKMKFEGPQVTWITAYDYPTAVAAERAEVDLILVGDSGGMCLLGYENTHPVTMDEMITMTKAVRRGAPNTFIIGDMPQGSYEVCAEDAVRNAMRFVKECGVDAVKLEGCHEKVVRALTKAGINVVGHLGLTPQSSETFGGYRVQGKTVVSFCSIMEDAYDLERAGICFLLLEGMPTYSAGKVKDLLNIPVYGVGAGAKQDGQLLIISDILGNYPNFKPRFAHNFVNDVLTSDFVESGETGFLTIAEEAIKLFMSEVKSGAFPYPDNIYPLGKDQVEFEKEIVRQWKLLHFRGKSRMARVFPDLVAGGKID